MRVTGTFLDSTREVGNFIPPDQDQTDESKRLSWDYTALHVLCGREVLKIRLPKGVHVHPFTKGEILEDLEVTVPKGTKITLEAESLGLSADAA